MNLKTARRFIKSKESTQNSFQSRSFEYSITDIQRQYTYNKSFSTEKMKRAISFLNKLGTETKLQSLDLKDILKGYWDFM